MPNHYEFLGGLRCGYTIIYLHPPSFSAIGLFATEIYYRSGTTVTHTQTDRHTYTHSHTHRLKLILSPYTIHRVEKNIETLYDIMTDIYFLKTAMVHQKDDLDQCHLGLHTDNDIYHYSLL